MRWWNLQLLKARSAGSRIVAVQKLAAEAHPDSVQPLISALSDSDPGVRTAAATGLSRFPGGATAVAAMSRLAVEPEPIVRRCLVRTLQELREPSTVPALVERLSDSSGEVSWQAAQALRLAAWEPANDTERAAWHLAVSQFDSAVVFGTAAVEPLVKLLQSTAFHRCIRAVEALAKVGGGQAVKPLLEALDHSDFTVRSTAATALGEVGDARAVDPLIRALRDAHHQVCLAAAASLSKMGDQRAVPPLIEQIEHRAPDVRTAVVEALGRLRDSRAVEPLVERLRDDDPDVREASALALGTIGDVAAIEPLVSLMVDAQATIRQAAAAALRRIEPYWERSEAALRAIPAIQASLKNREYWVRHSAADLLKKLGLSQHEETTLVTDTDGARRKRQAAHTLLLAMLEDKDREFRQAAAEALGRIGVAECIPALVRRLADPDRWVRLAVARALEAFRWQSSLGEQKARQLVALERWSEITSLGADAVEPLAEAFAWLEPASRRGALDVLVQIGGAPAIAALKKISVQAAPDVREEASAALVLLGSSAPHGAARRLAPDPWVNTQPTL